MSCGNPETESDALMQRRPKFDRTRDCIKCKERKGNIVIRHAVYCKGCFQPLVASKFKRLVEPTISNRNAQAKTGARQRASGSLLIGFSGGLGSTVLLELVHSCYFRGREEKSMGVHERDKRSMKIWEKVVVCYVELANAFPELRDKTEDMKRAVAKYDNFTFLPIRLENAFDPDWWAKLSGSDTGTSSRLVDLANEDLPASTFPRAETDPISSLRTYVSSLPTQTAVAASISTLVRLLLLYTGHSMSCSHVLLGTSLTSHAISLISSVSQGGGYTVREEAREEWRPRFASRSDAQSISLNRPLRDSGSKECALWAWWNNLDVIGGQIIPGGRQDIGKLTKEFIIGLERDYPSTVSTITRTCAKLAPKQGSSASCIMCERPAQAGVQEWKSRISIRSFAEQTSPSVISCLPQNSLSPLLCYACHTTLTSRSSRSNMPTTSQGIMPIPSWVSAHLTSEFPKEESEEVWTQKLDGDGMRERIGEFILDED